MNSKHYQTERKNREEIISSLGGEGKAFKSFRINRGHRDGEEIHTVTFNAIIVITNANSGKVITKLIGRPEQIDRYFRRINCQTPKFLMDLAREHKKLGLNES